MKLVPAEPSPPEPRRRLGGPHCPACGRFSKVIRGAWVYLGYASEYRLTVRCKVHGLQDIY